MRTRAIRLAVFVALLCGCAPKARTTSAAPGLGPSGPATLRCADCGAEHPTSEMEPTYRRPDLVVALSPEERRRRVRESDDVCNVEPAAPGDPARAFVRCILEVAVHDRPHPTRWGLWAEVSVADLARVEARWSDPAQADEPPMAATLANGIACFPDTIGLPVTLRLTGPSTRPALAFGLKVDHPFAAECRAGVTAHRVSEWLATFR